VTPHRIRLEGFWSPTPLGDGRVRHVRRFGRPRVLDPDETIWVTGTAPGPATVLLNGEPLGDADGPFAFDVTAKLLPRNELAIDGSGQPEGVALEIRSRLSNT
jgi:hypothetical protein